MKPQTTKFQGGHPKLGGRRKGTPNVATAESKAFATRLVTDKTYQANLKKRLLAGKLHPGVEQMLWHYAHGKPKDHLELDDKRETSEVERIRKLDPADLRRELAEAYDEIGKALGKGI